MHTFQRVLKKLTAAFVGSECELCLRIHNWSSKRKPRESYTEFLCSYLKNVIDGPFKHASSFFISLNCSINDVDGLCDSLFKLPVIFNCPDVTLKLWRDHVTDINLNRIAYLLHCPKYNSLSSNRKRTFSFNSYFAKTFVRELLILLKKVCLFVFNLLYENMITS